MNGDDHDRILRLEEKMDRLTEKVATFSGGLKVWAVVLGLLASVAGTVLTNKLTAPAAPTQTSIEQNTKAVEDLVKAIRENNDRKEVSR